MNLNPIFRRFLPKVFFCTMCFAGVGLAFLMEGCVVAERRPRHVTVVESVPPPRETVVVHASAPSVREVVVIKEAPPPPRREIVVERERPSSRHVWISGYWVWRDRRHEWIPGRWEVPPRARAVWVEPRWERRGDGYVFIEGVWR